jgi:hypothetical protein
MCKRLQEPSCQLEILMKMARAQLSSWERHSRLECNLESLLPLAKMNIWQNLTHLEGALLDKPSEREDRGEVGYFLQLDFRSPRGKEHSLLWKLNSYIDVLIKEGRFLKPDQAHWKLWSHGIILHAQTLQTLCWMLNLYKPSKKKKLHGLSPRANYTDRATAASRRSVANLCG